MKRILSLILAAITVVSAFASCTAEESAEISTNVTVATSDAQSHADWLTDRLGGSVPDSVVLGIGSDTEYGVDMTDFEDDGYIIKTLGEDTLLLGKTADGLDRAVRKYANSVDLGTALEDTVYHEGYRVEKFTLFGRDISDYTVVMPESYNANMELAATDFVNLVKKACGVELPLVIGETDASPLIRLEHSDKEELKVGGFEYFEENGDLVISGAVREGCANGVYRFFENECDWNWLIYGNSDLQETDHLVIEEGLYKKEVPAFEWHRVSANRSNLVFETDRTVDNIQTLTISTEQQSYPIVHANHGLTKHNWANWVPNNHTGQICYTTESYLYTVIDNVLAYLEEHEANGGVVGETIRDIDISQGDSGMYCDCTNCMAMVGEEGSLTGPVVRFANEVAEAVNAEYPGANIIFKIFAYYKAFDAPKVTAPNEWVSVSYAPNGACANHTMDGKQCDPDTATEFGVSGVQFGQYLTNWCDISDNIYVWYYHIGENFNYYNAWDLIYYDYKHMYDLGVKGVYFYNYDRGMGLKNVEHLLAWYMQWNIDATWEEYEDMFHTILEKQYGDGWENILEILRMYEEMDDGSCWQCWGYGDKMDATERYDLGYLAENGDEMMELFEKAILLAGDADQQERGEMFSISLYYCYCYANFFKAYNANDTEKLSELEGYYQLILDRLAKNGYDYQKLPTILALGMKDNIWDEALEEWVGGRGNLPEGDSPKVEYSKATAMVKDIAELGDITSYDEAVSVIKILEDYKAFSAEDQEKVENIGVAKAALEQAVTFFDEDSLKLKVMGFNVYYSNLVPERIDLVVQRISEEMPDVLGIQEGMLPTCDGILDALGDTYEMVGIGREATDDSENCNIFYRKDKFELLDYGTIWLTRTPDRYSIFSGAQMPRIATYVLLQRKSDGQVFVHANTHYDLASDTVRKAESIFLSEYLAKEFGEMYPTVITGDFNCTEGSAGYTTLIDAGYKPTNTYGEKLPTYQAWGTKESYIDFNFVNEMFPVKSYKVCTDTIDGEYPSDHNALVSELILIPTYASLTGEVIE